MRTNNSPLAWRLYEEGRSYNTRLSPNQYDLVETNTEFFAGNQWLHLPDTPAMRGLPKPTFNILKRVASLFIASLTSSGVALRYEPMAYYDGSSRTDPHYDEARFTNAAVSNLLEKLRFDYRVREALFDGAQTGDYCAHFYFDPDALPYGGAFGPHRGEIKMELVDGINVMFGNPASCRVQDQPYILLVGRAPVAALQAEAERVRSRRAEGAVQSVQADSDYALMPGSGGKVELAGDEDTGKALYVLLYTKVTRDVEEMDAQGRVQHKKVTTVHVTKATRDAVIYEDVDTGLSLYPIAWGNWERQKNQYHGRALVTGLIPNQIFINSMFATAMRHMQLMAFPKTIYNADLISSWTNEVGQAIAIHGLQPGEGVGQVAANLQPAEMSNQIFALIDKAMAYTKECLGATDAQMGNVRPDNTSALLVLQTNAEIPLENVRAGVYEWTEDIGNILPDMMATYYGTRPVVVERELEEMQTDGSGQPMLDPATGQLVTRKVVRRVTEDFDFTRLKHVCLNLRIDVGAATYFSEIAMTQTLDNLRRDGTLDMMQYLERVPDKLIPRKQELIEELRTKAGQAMAPQSPADQKAGTADHKKLGQLPPPIQARYQQLDGWAKRGADLAAQQKGEPNRTKGEEEKLWKSRAWSGT